MQDDEITVRFAAHDKSGKSDLTAAELGALMTGLSRSLNKLYLESPQLADRLQEKSRRAMSYEPTAIGLKIVSLRAGSVTLNASVAILSDGGVIREVAKELVLGVLTHAIYERFGRKILLYDFGRAVKRVSRGAYGKTFDLALRFANKPISLHATVSQQGKVELRAEQEPWDDVQ